MKKEEIIELNGYNFNSCLSSDDGNYQPLHLVKAGEILAEFVLKPISEGDLISIIRPDTSLDRTKMISCCVIKWKLKTSDGYKEGTTMTEEQVKNLLPIISNPLFEQILKMAYVTKAEEKNSETLSAGSEQATS